MQHALLAARHTITNGTLLHTYRPRRSALASTLSLVVLLLCCLPLVAVVIFIVAIASPHLLW